MRICEVEMNIGDYVEVQYMTGKHCKGSILKGNITKLWDTSGNDFPIAPRKQGEIGGAWCFHNHDMVLKHIANK